MSSLENKLLISSVFQHLFSMSVREFIGASCKLGGFGQQIWNVVGVWSHLSRQMNALLLSPISHRHPFSKLSIHFVFNFYIIFFLLISLHCYDVQENSLKLKSYSDLSCIGYNIERVAFYLLIFQHKLKTRNEIEVPIFHTYVLQFIPKMHGYRI